MKKLIAFDLDGTLAKSKTEIDKEMSELIIKLLGKYKVAIISGGDYPQFEKKVIPFIKNKILLSNLYLFPTCGTKAFIFKDGIIKKLYSEDLSDNEIEKATKSINFAIQKLEINKEETYGEKIENRGTQITYSALGQDAPYEKKEKWDPDYIKRIEIKNIIDPLIPELKVSIGGTTSIDITKKGIDKTFAINKLEKYLNITTDEMIFIGDALKKGGNDFPVIKTGVKCIETAGPEETKKIIKNLIINK